MPTKEEINLARTVRTVENSDPIVNVAEHVKGIVIEIDADSKKLDALPENVCFMRREVAELLGEAKTRLPVGLSFKLVDGYRSLAAQMTQFWRACNEINQKDLSMTAEAVITEAKRWVAHPDEIVPPHCTGGALDLTIVDETGKELDMGTGVNDISVSGKVPLYSDEISEIAKANRAILISAMSAVGFVNNPKEWWHWSYGDWRWALAKKETAIYSIVKQYEKNADMLRK